MARVLVLCSLICVAASAAPRKVSPEEMQRARLAYDAGATAFRAELFRDAEQAFREVYQLTGSGVVLYDLALSLEKQRRWSDAAEAFEGYLREAPRVKDRRRVEARVAELRERARRQEELDAAMNRGASPPPSSSSPGNEVMALGALDELQGYGESAAAPAPAPARLPERRPIWKAWWLWAAVGVAVVAGVAVGVGVAVTRSPSLPPATFGDVGPGAVVQF